jgi:hypothetical protein
MSYCQALTSLPDSFSSLGRLRPREMCDCRSLISLLDSFGSRGSMQPLVMSYDVSIESLPKSLFRLVVD